MVKIISIEGNIGSGKSTIVQYLKKYYGDKYIFVQEPVQEWNTICDENGETILSHFYRDNKQYSFQFQMMAYISRLNVLMEIIKKNPNAIIITERCLFTDKHVFAKMLYDTNNMTQIEYTIYNKWFSCFIDNITIDGIIYIYTQPDICEKRIIHRNRKGEKIPLQYLNACHEYHNNWLGKSKIPITRYNGNVDIDTNNINDIIQELDLCIQKIINSTSNI